jgi:hypothetical protein
MNDGVYDNWKATNPSEQSDEPSVPCPICTGDEEAEACSEECHTLIERCRRERMIERLYKASHKAIRFAKQYKLANYPEFHLHACVVQVNANRAVIRRLRSEAA